MARIYTKLKELVKRKGIVRKKVKPSGIPSHVRRIVVNGLVMRIVVKINVGREPERLNTEPANSKLAPTIIAKHNIEKVRGVVNLVKKAITGRRTVSCQ